MEKIKFTPEELEVLILRLDQALEKDNEYELKAQANYVAGYLGGALECWRERHGNQR